MSGFGLNIVFSGGTLTSGGEIVSSGAVFSGGSLVISGGMVTMGGSTTSGSTLSISGGSVLTLNTTLPEDPNSAYQQYVTDKKLAMISGGTATLNGISQEFENGYAGISSTHLMSINGVYGYTDTAEKHCCITITPSVGIWPEPISGGTITVFRALPPCVTCDDYNKLFAAEMVLYHAINKAAWKILDNGAATETAPMKGIWYRYQGLLAYWSFVTYSDAFLNYNCSVRENLAVNLGYANPGCSPVNFVCLSVVSCTSPAEGSLQSDLLFYPGNMITSNSNRDNNAYREGDPIPFIIAYTGSGENIRGAQIYCGGASGASINQLTSMTSGVTVSSYPLSSIVTGGQVLSSIQDFTTRPAQGGWILGLAGHLAGQQYAAQPYTLAPAGSTTVACIADDTKLDTYSIETVWWLSSESTFDINGRYQKSLTPAIFKTHSLQPEV